MFSYIFLLTGVFWSHNGNSRTSHRLESNGIGRSAGQEEIRIQCGRSQDGMIGFHGNLWWCDTVRHVRQVICAPWTGSPSQVDMGHRTVQVEGSRWAEHCVGDLKTVANLIIMLRGGATAYGSSFVCVCVSLRLLCQFRSACWTVSIETCNASRTWYYLAFEHLKVSYEALFSSYGVIWLPLLAIRTSLKSILSTVVCLAACRIGLYHKIGQQVWRIMQVSYGKG